MPIGRYCGCSRARWSGDLEQSRTLIYRNPPIVEELFADGDDVGVLHSHKSAIRQGRTRAHHNTSAARQMIVILPGGFHYSFSSLGDVTDRQEFDGILSVLRFVLMIQSAVPAFFLVQCDFIILLLLPRGEFCLDNLPEGTLSGPHS